MFFFFPLLNLLIAVTTAEKVVVSIFTADFSFLTIFSLLPGAAEMSLAIPKVHISKKQAEGALLLYIQL